MSSPAPSSADQAASLPDSEWRGALRLIPRAARDYVLLARLDRPIGWWLLFWPCAWGLFLAGGGQWTGGRPDLVAWMLVGAIAMRGAGCVYNDIVDADLDARVARTAGRPIASGRVSKRAAWVWLLTLCAIGLIVLLQLRWQAELVALGSVALVAAYPFMKRLTGWPQVWLGLVFTWGLPTGWIAMRGDALPAMLAFYAGSAAWVVGYDTIYALQDREDDALIGIGSSARSMGSAVRPGIGLCYALALALWALGIWWRRPDPLALLALLPAALHFAWQVVTLEPDDGANALARFRSNRFAGLLVALACYVVGNAGMPG